MSRTGIAGSESINFTKYCFSAFQDSCSHLHSHHRRWRFLLFMFCQTCGMIHAHNVSRMIYLYVIFIFSIPEVEQWITLLLAKWSSRPWVDIPAQWNWLSSPTWPQYYWLLAYSLPSGSSFARLPPPSALWISTEFLISLVASLLMGFGVPFLLPWVSMYIWTLKGSNQVASWNPCFGQLIVLLLLGAPSPAAHNKGRCVQKNFHFCIYQWTWASPYKTSDFFRLLL